MKTTQTSLSVWALAAILSGSTLVACAQTTSTGSTAATTASDPSKTTLLTPLQQSITKLKKIVSTGDPDFDYCFQAKAHAQGVQDLLKAEIQNGKDTGLVNMAKAMVPVIDKDIAMFDATVRQLKPTRPSQAYAQKQSQNIEAMSLKLQQTGSSDKLTGNLDKNFSTLLLDQRQDAIDMATTYLEFGKNESLRNYAQQMVDKSKQQMAAIKAQQPK